MSLSGHRVASLPRLRPGPRQPTWCRALLALPLVILGTLSVAGQTSSGGGLSACLNSLTQTTRDVSCEYTALLTVQERADMRRLTRDRLQDAVCRVKVRVRRGLVEPALTEANHVFKAPPQPVVCTITTRDSTFDVTGTFEPQVTFKDGKATYATPGLGNVTGVSKVLSWPVIQYVNYAPGIRRDMIAIINAYRSQLTGK